MTGRQAERNGHVLEQVPVALWEEDVSEVRRRLRRMAEQGIGDLRGYLNAHPGAVRDLAGRVRVLEVNRAALALYRAGSRGALLEGIQRVYTERSYALFREFALGMFRGRTEMEGEDVRRRLDGTPVHLLVRWAVAPGHEEDGARVVVSHLDITRRKRAEEALRKSESLFRALFESSPTGIAVVDTATQRFLSANPGFCTLVGYSETELLDLTVPDITYPEDWPDEEGRIRSYLDHASSDYSIVKRYVRKDGETRWVLLTGEVIQAPDASPPLAIACAQDITDRIRMERELRFQADLLDQIQDGVVATDLEGRITYVNAASSRNLGRDKRDLVGRPVSTFGEDLAQGACQEEIVQATREQGRWRGEVVNRASDGRRVIWETRTQLLKEPDGAPSGMLGISTDVTAQKSAESRLRQSETRYRELVENIRDVLFTLDREGRIVYISPVVRSVTGHEPEKLQGRHFSELLHPEDLSAIGRAFEDLKAGREYPSEYRVRARDGSWRWMRSSSRPVFEDGRFQGVRGLLSDITEARKAEMDARRLIEALNQIAEGIVVTDPEGTIEYVNPAFSRITGYAAVEAVGGNPRMLQSGRQDSAFYRDLWETITAGRTWSGRMVNRRKDGSLYTGDCTISAVCDPKGTVVNYVAVQRDISRELGLESRLRQAQKMESIGTLAGGIAHDFNNILAAITGFSELARDGITPESQAWEDLNEVFRASRRAKALVKQILTFSRQAEQKPRPVRVTPIVKECLKMLRASLPSTLEIQERMGSNLPTVFADPTAIHQIVMNLCTNAAHAMDEEGGRLEVELADVVLDRAFASQHTGLVPGRHLCIRVADTGCGMNDEVRDRLFDPYFTTKEPGEGTGLGLAVVHGLVQDYGGEIIVESAEGRGSRFDVYIPGMVEKPAEDQEKAEQSLYHGQGRVLFVDDEAPIVALGERMLRRLGFEVTACTDPKEALERFRADPGGVDLLITDMTMPRMRGDDLVKAVLAIRADLPVVLCTGFSQRISEEAARALGIRAFVMKPLSMWELGNTLKEILEGAA